MKIVAFSDTHGHHKELDLPRGEVLIFAGDITMRGEIETYASFFEWFRNQPHPIKIGIPGNHDRDWPVAPVNAGRWLMRETEFLNHGDVVLHGDPMVPMPPGRNWPFSLLRGSEELKQYREREIDLIPTSPIDVLLTHGPPSGVLDQITPQMEHLGDDTLWPVIEELRPKIHIFGHIHGGHGHIRRHHVDFYNVAVCNEQYELAYEPTVIEF